jgi:dynein heavy chain
LTEEDYNINGTVFRWAQDILPALAEAEEILGHSRKENESELATRREIIRNEIEAITKNMEELKSFGEPSEVSRYCRTSQKLRSRLDNVQARIKNLNHEQELMGWPKTNFSNYDEVDAKLSTNLLLYQTLVDFETNSKAWMNGPLQHVDAEKVDEDLTNTFRTLYSLNNTFQSDSCATNLINSAQVEVERMKTYLPLFRVLCNPGMRTRHWMAISESIKTELSIESSTSFSSLLQFNLGHHMEALETISGAASKEYGFEKALQKMYTEWEPIQFEVVSYRDTGTFVLASVDDIQVLLDDHLVKTQTMRGSPFIKVSIITIKEIRI